MSVDRDDPPTVVVDHGSAPRSQLWRSGGTPQRDVSTEQIVRTLHEDPEARAWWTLPRRRSPDLTSTARLLKLDSLAVDDVVSPVEYPKLDTVERTVVIVSAAVFFDPESTTLTVQRVSLLANRRALVIIGEDRQVAELTSAIERCGDRLLTEGVAVGIHAVVSALAEGYAQALAAMEDVGEAFSGLLFNDRPLAKADQLRAFKLRTALGQLRRVTFPMVEVTGALANAALRPGDEQTVDPIEVMLDTSTARRFADVAEHCRHTSDGTFGLREELNAAFETNLALADVHLNQIMKKLSAWAAIIAVPTLITGFFGMNVPYPGFGQGPGFYVGLAIMITAVITLFVAFKRHDWL